LLKISTNKARIYKEHLLRNGEPVTDFTDSNAAVPLSKQLQILDNFVFLALKNPVRGSFGHSRSRTELDHLEHQTTWRRLRKLQAHPL
jgi:hypothetical protein